MSKLLCVTWHLVPRRAPRIRRGCKRCNTRTLFACSGKFRINAQKKRLDVWLIYRCIVCDETWNLPIVERIGIARIEADALRAYASNDPAAVARHALDAALLGRQGDCVEPCDDYTISKRWVCGEWHIATSLQITITLDQACDLRLDKLLSRELGVPRSVLRGMNDDGALQVIPPRRKALRSPVTDGQRIQLDLNAMPALRMGIERVAGP